MIEALKLLKMMPILIAVSDTPAASEAKARQGQGLGASLVSQKPSTRQKSVQWEDQSSENKTYEYDQ